MSARRHHFISQCYLKGFAMPRTGKGACLNVFSRGHAKPFVARTEKVGLERDFNRIEIDGIEPDDLEHGLSKFESQLAIALRRTIAAGCFASEDDRAIILNFIGLLAMRNPRWRERSREIREQIAKTMLSIVLAKRERWEHQRRKMIAAGYLDGTEAVSYEEIKDAHESGRYKLTVPTEKHIQTEFRGFDRLLPYLFNRRWMFLKAPPGSGGFVTSDHPVNVVWSESKSHGLPPGFGVVGTEVLFPISYKLAVIGAFELDGGTREVTEELVARFNGTTIHFANRQVYARDMNFHYELQEGEGIQKALHLVSDHHFRRLAANDGDSAVD